MKNNFIFICKKGLKIIFENFLYLFISIIFFLILTPFGLITKFLGIDLLNLKKKSKKKKLTGK